jgi:hypothetical protein
VISVKPVDLRAHAREFWCCFWEELFPELSSTYVFCLAFPQVRDWYVDSFKDLRSFTDIRDMQDELRFTELIYQIKMRHNNVMPTMAMGIQELKEDLGRKVGLNEIPEIHQFLDRFYMSRIGIRMLIGMISCIFYLATVAAVVVNMFSFSL